ncbi:MAG TPA: efflux RND transporter periplasmic adaptor subunit [Bryobacteraceae bacterium]|jgi:membrane fusion protein (multidrug efflux system)|nr:efflux RND transporter periplasmic adaptor subunit [Bryobacteraceae bacterium]
MTVSFVQARIAEVALRDDWVGTMDGYVNAQIQPQVSGYLIEQNYREGQVVTKGEVLFRIDPRPFRAALDQTKGQIGQAEGQRAQAEGQLAQAQAQEKLAQINVERDTPLASQRAIAQSQLDNEKQQLAQTEANVRTALGAIAAARASIASAKANADAAALNLDFTEVRSLIGGVAGQATTQVGNLVSPQSVLTSVSQLDPIKVYFSIADDEYLALSKKSAKTEPDLLRANVPLTLTLADGSVYPHAGRIIFVDRQMNQQTGAIRLAATFANPGNVLRPGEFGRVSATTQVIRDALLVPQAAVTDLQGQKQVYTIAADNKVHVVNVTLGAQYGEDWIIKSGLEPGTRVITTNLQKLREGEQVNPQAAGK